MFDDASCHLSCYTSTHGSIWHHYGDVGRLKDNGGHDLDFLGSRDVMGNVTICLPAVDFLWAVHSDHASIWHCYGDMAV